MTPFVVEHRTLCDGWVNCWSDADGSPIIFQTLTDAYEALNEFLVDAPQERFQYRVSPLVINDNLATQGA